MTVTVDLSPEIEAKIKTQAEKGGVKFEDYVKSLLEEASIRREKLEALSEKSFDEILAPVRKGFQQSGLSEVELTELFEEAREEVYQERKSNGK
jgi:hypothetical protein